MIAEKLPFTVDIQKLRDHFQQVVRPLEPARISRRFGGWSVLSSDGTYKDGWTQAAPQYGNDEYQNLEDVRKFMKSAELKRTYQYSKPTEVCTGYMKELIDQWEELGFSPRRARFMLLEPKGHCLMHRDAPEWLYSVRLHVPIFTNPDCFFEVENEGAENLKADGSVYLLKVNRMHRVWNQGLTDRIHLIADIHDRKGISQFHRFTKEDMQKIEQRKVPVSAAQA